MFIEDLLHTLVDTVELNVNDKPILVSINQQVKKGTALTDRQHELIKTKLLSYQDRFDFDIQPFFDNLKIPLRVIDRSQTIEVVSHADMLGPNSVYESHKENWKWIKIRFPFSKKNIIEVETIVQGLKKRDQYMHVRGSHEHYFRLNETNVFAIVKAFVNKKFAIDEELVEHYKNIKDIKDNENSYYPGVFNFSVSNISDKGKQIINDEIGAIDKSNILKVVDRRRRYGIQRIDYSNIPAGLSGEIAFRNNIEVLIDPASHNLNSVAEAVMHLDRFPLLVIIDKDDALAQMSKVYDAFSYIVPTNKQTALFRVDSNNDYNVNDFIKDKQLNNWLDKDTEIVYINKGKLPKLLLKTEWKPSAALIMTGTRSHSYVSYYVEEFCDLIMYHDKESSILRKLHKSYAYM